MKSPLNAYQRHYKKKRAERPLYFIVKQARQRARQLGLEHNINDLEIKIPTHCPVLGIELKSGVNWNDDHSYSLDRVDNSKGYTKDNVRVISFLANNLKSANTLETLDKIREYMKREMVS